MIPLEKEEIFSQLGAIEKPAVVLYCRRVGEKPMADLISVDGHEEIPCKDYSILAVRLVMSRRASWHRLVILTDIYVAGNEPPARVRWDTSMRTQGAIMGAMSHLIILMRQVALRRMLMEDPEQLVIGTIEDRKITIHPEQGPKMVRFIGAES